MRVHRLIAILMMIEKNGKTKANKLAHELEVSTRTIYRDIDALSEAGFPVYATTGPDGGICFADGYALGLEANDSEVSKLLPTLINHLQVIPDKATTAQSIEAGFQQIQSLLKGEQSDKSPISDRILIDEEAWWGGDSDPFDIKVLIDALWSLEQLEMTYQKADGSTSIRKIDSYGLILKHTNWYLVAFCHNSNSIRTFRCERILTCNKTGTFYQIPGNFSLKNHWKQTIKSFANNINSSEDYLVRLQVPSTFINHFNNDDTTWNEKLVDSYIITVNMNTYSIAKQELIEIAGFVKVLGPSELRNFAKDLLAKQLDQYN